MKNENPTSAPRHISSSRTNKTLKLGIVGVGVGGTEILRAIDDMAFIQLVAGADVVPETLARFANRYPQAQTYSDPEKLFADSSVDAVWISSPNRFHAQHAISAARHGKHIVVEKPMAVSLREAAEMVEAADQNAVILLAGHTLSYTQPVRAIRKIIRSGKFGQLRALNIWSYSDWILRPRTSDELDFSQGGGVPYRQAPHQVDTVRLLGGGLVRSVRAQIGQWLRERPIPGYYAAFMEFEDGTPATIVHNGYGYFVTNELVPWGGDRAVYGASQRAAIREAIRNGHRDELREKQALRIGGEEEQGYFGATADDWLPGDLGMAIASLDRADLRHSRSGLYLHDDLGKRELNLRQDKLSGISQRRAELEELYDGVIEGKPISHDGRWGMATLEVCLAIIQSAQERQEIKLVHQVPIDDRYDEDLRVDGI